MFTAWQIVGAKQVVPLPDMDPQYLPFMLSGLTAAISLDKVRPVWTLEILLLSSPLSFVFFLTSSSLSLCVCAVSYTHLTLPTNSRV